MCCTVKTKIEGRTVRTKKQIRKNTKREREKEFGITVEARFSAPVQTVPGTHPDYYKMGAGPVSPGRNVRGVALTTYPHLAPRLKKE